MDSVESGYRALLRSTQGDNSKLLKILSSLPLEDGVPTTAMGSLSVNTPSEDSDVLTSTGNLSLEDTAIISTNPKAVMAIVNGTECLFLMKLPLEMRRKVYFYVVVSNKTSDFTRDANGNYATSVKFGLTPAILRTCKQIYIEASEMMYANNTLTIKCLGSTSSWLDNDQLGPCTLGRHPLLGEVEQRVFSSVRDLPAFEKVQRWKVIVNPDDPANKATTAPAQVVAFCRAVCDVTSLKSLVISKFCGACLDKADDGGFLFPIPDQEQYRANRDHNLLVALKPFEMLRNLSKFEVQCPECKTFKDIGDGEILKMETLIKSNEPVHHVFKCYAALLQYAQSFERIPLFRSDMASERMLEISSVSYNNRRANMPPTSLNPYIFPNVHPVEEALRLARKAADVNDYEDFKEHRVTVLQQLERQYIRIGIMSTQVEMLVKSQKEQGGCLYENQVGYDHHAFQIDDDLKVICLIRLQDYAKTFIRDSPETVRISLRRYEWIVKRLYAGLPRERYLQDLENAYDMQDLHTFRESFIKATGDMYDQWLKIRFARRKLMYFDWDPENTGCKINFELWREDVPVDFN